MPVTTKPNEQRNRGQGDFTWEQFAKDCVNNRYALVIGGEAVLNRNVNPEAEGNSQKLLFDLTLRQMATKEDFDEHKYLELKREFNNFTELIREHNNERVKDNVLKTLRNNDFFPLFDEEIEPSLMKLLQTRCFRIVLSTTIDPYVEIAMEKVWGKGNFDVVQIENAQQTFKQISYSEFGVTRPVLCHVFGKADPNKPYNKFVLTENDAMEKIASWFKSHDSNNFLNFLKHFQLFSVGNKFDDWMFRFFWYLLRDKFGNTAGGQQVAVEIKNDDKLKHYLENEKVKVFADARSFIQEACNRINIATDINLLPRKENGVFISYAHEDRYIALPLFERLHATGVNVWLDEEKLEGGAEYEQRIRNAINTCRVFMPILSSQVKSDLVSGNIANRWYHQEWDWAQRRHNDEGVINGNGMANFKIIPVIVGDYRFSEEYHQKLPACIVKATAFDTAKDTFEHLIRLTNA